LKSKNLLFVGSGVSGGEEGARYGPSLMPGGHADAWPLIQPIFQVSFFSSISQIKINIKKNPSISGNLRSFRHRSML
jgi:6-phosphogluconate dehydrogenase (decarboxylating)